MTIFTLERLFSSMDTLMTYEVGDLTEGLIASLVGALIWLLFIMDSGMLL